MSRLKILWLTSWYPDQYDPFDGDFIQRHARTAAMDHDVHVICVKPANNEITTRAVSVPANGLTEEVIHCQSNFPVRTMGTHLSWSVAYSKAIRTYIARHGLPHLVHIHVPWKAGLMALWVKRKWGVPFVVTEHWGIYNDLVPDNFSKRPLLVRMLLKQILKESKLLLSVSDYLGRAMCHAVVKKEYRTIPNVVNTALFFPVPPATGVFTFLHVSNMVPLKNVEGILRAFSTVLESRNSPARLVLVGNRNDELPRFAARLGLTQAQVVFTGEIPYDEVARQMQAAHCLLLNSTIENAPCTISEAHCCGLPVIATSVGGIPEMVTVQNGILVPPSDDEALASAMRQMQQQHDAFDRSSIARIATARYGTDAIREAFRSLYRDVR